MFRASIPVLRVGDIDQALTFYAKLGFLQHFRFQISEAPNPSYCGLQREGVYLHLSSFPGDGNGGGVVYFVVEDVDALEQAYRQAGVPIAMEATDQTWGNREMYVQDADGNSLRFVVEG